MSRHNEPSPEAVEIARKISSLVNNMSFPYSDVAKVLSRDHRTLQQNFMRLCGEYIREMAKQEYPDLRNEASVGFAKAVVERFEDKMYFPHV